jgi:ABC-type uncharacterized transport system fused permease/ATPase subunit
VQRDTKVEALSGGEKARLVFAELTLLAPQVRPLDPTYPHLSLSHIYAGRRGLKAVHHIYIIYTSYIGAHHYILTSYIGAH